MSYHLDEKLDVLTFLYKFKPGVCPSSFGIKVAKQSGLPPKILKIAAQKSKEFSKRLNSLTGKLIKFDQ